MGYLRRGLLVAGIAGVGVAVVRRRRPPPDPLVSADREFAAETWTAEPAAVEPDPVPSVAEPVAEVAEVPTEPAAEPAHLAYLPHLQRYQPEVDHDALRGIVRHCGISLRNRDASIVSAGDPVELSRIREGLLRKKLGLEHPDAELDTAIGDLMATMTGDRAKSRVTVYYLLAERFGKLDVFR